MNEQLSITLPADMVAVIKEQVEAGRYASTSDMLRAAMKRWMRDEEEHADRIAQIRAEIAEAIADPRPLLTSAEVEARLDALAERYRDRDQS
jgi:antitoxin ParD1/3/4